MWLNLINKWFLQRLIIMLVLSQLWSLVWIFDVRRCNYAAEMCHFYKRLTSNQQCWLAVYKPNGQFSMMLFQSVSEMIDDDSWRVIVGDGWRSYSRNGSPHQVKPLNQQSTAAKFFGAPWSCYWCTCCWSTVYAAGNWMMMLRYRYVMRQNGWQCRIMHATNSDDRYISCHVESGWWTFRISAKIQPLIPLSHWPSWNMMLLDLSCGIIIRRGENHQQLGHWNILKPYPCPNNFIPHSIDESTGRIAHHRKPPDVQEDLPSCWWWQMPPDWTRAPAQGSARAASSCPAERGAHVPSSPVHVIHS